MKQIFSYNGNIHSYVLMSYDILERFGSIQDAYLESSRTSTMKLFRENT